MNIRRLILRNFKQHRSLITEFSEHITCITGPNGSGKTNILDAIYFLSFTKSFLVNQDLSIISENENQLMIDGIYTHDNFELNVQMRLDYPGKKVFKFNNNPIKKLSDHIGTIPLVIIAPQDIWLFQEGSSDRRKLMDMALCQLNPNYLNQLNIYNKTLEQCNKYLKHLNENQIKDLTQLESYHELLISSGNYIYNQRKQFIEHFKPHLIKNYQDISKGVEEISLEYMSPLNSESFENILKKNIERDIILNRISSGIHKDDLQFKINNFILKSHGSQGQQKTYIIAIKLAIAYYIYSIKNIYPILLLDDIFEKLDSNRSHTFLQKTMAEYPGQVIITDTELSRCQEAFKGIHIQYLELQHDIQPNND